MIVLSNHVAFDFMLNSWVRKGIGYDSFKVLLLLVHKYYNVILTTILAAILELCKLDNAKCHVYISSELLGVQYLYIDMKFNFLWPYLTEIWPSTIMAKNEPLRGGG
mgnify:CR=1 FL=1